MLRLTDIARDLGGLRVAGVLTLAFGDRRRSRLRLPPRRRPRGGAACSRGARCCATAIDCGPRQQAVVVVVRAANEMLSWVRADNRLLLARAAYHLGNRHVPVQIGPGWLAYEHDHVLDGMIAEMGLPVEARRAPFEPEAGGYRHAGSESPTHGGHHHHDH